MLSAAVVTASATSLTGNVISFLLQASKCLCEPASVIVPCPSYLKLDYQATNPNPNYQAKVSKSSKQPSESGIGLDLN